MASLKASDSEQQSDETFELLCSICKRKERNTEADKYCADCNDYYCSDCVKFHEDIPFLSGHKILNKGQEGAKQNLPVAPTERCERHRFKPVDMYCQNHDDVGCYTCMAVDHRTCKDIFDIPEYVQNNTATPDVKPFREELERAKGSLKENIESRRHEKELLLKSKEESLQSLQQFREDINKRLDELEQNSIAAIEKEYKVLIDKIDEDIRVLENSQTEVNSAAESLISSGSNASQLFVSSRKGKRAAERAARCSEETSTGKKRLNIIFRMDKKLLAFLEEINSFGRIRQPNDMYKLTNKKQYNIRHHTDKKVCNISSACVLEDGTTFLADRGNKKLKRIDKHYTIVDVCDLQMDPWQICPSDSGTVAVISFGGKAVVFISVGNEMKKTREITTNHTCYGIAVANGKIYVADSITSVFVYSMSGIKLNQFSKDQTGQKLFDNLYHMTVSDDGMKIYMTDHTYGLVVLNMDGTLHGKYSCPELKGARRVCVTDDGSALISGDDNNCILQFTSDGEKVGNVMATDTGNDKCGAICFDPQRHKLLVGRPNKDEIDIYDLLLKGT